jgi:hypothetical protein
MWRKRQGRAPKSKRQIIGGPFSLIQLQICIQSERWDAEFSWLNEWNCKKWPANAAEAERRLECRDRVTAPFLLLAILQPSWKQVTPCSNQQANHLISVICAGRSHVSITAQIIATNSREPFLNRTSHAGKNGRKIGLSLHPHAILKPTIRNNNSAASR